MEVARVVLDYLQALVWPSVVLVVLLVLRIPVTRMIERIRHADLPGGVSVDLHEDIQEARQITERIRREPLRVDAKGRPSIPLTQANARLIELGLKPSPSGLDLSYYRTLAAQDPTLSLAGLRIEIDILARNLASGFRVPTKQGDSGFRLINKLHTEGAITADQFNLTKKVLEVCNAAIHGRTISKPEADSIIDAAEVLARQYIDWLSWGFD